MPRAGLHIVDYALNAIEYRYIFLILLEIISNNCYAVVAACQSNGE